MKTRHTMGIPLYAVLVILTALTSSGSAFAEERPVRAPIHQHFDSRFSHNRYYFDRGYAIRTVPHTGYTIEHARNHFYYDRGQWFRRNGARWVVVGAPFGAFVPVLPPFHTTIWFGGLPYYYANDTYYIWDDGHQEYKVVQPPSGIDNSATTQSPPSDAVFIYPKNGQSPEQQARDKYECHRSALDQTGYDPTLATGGVQPEVAAAKRADYFRAQAACLEARDYSVK